eukprot:Skav230157  [mRNA]  locus=scaffold1301:605695:622414:- [translate_table: standard]
MGTIYRHDSNALRPGMVDEPRIARLEAAKESGRWVGFVHPHSWLRSLQGGPPSHGVVGGTTISGPTCLLICGDRFPTWNEDFRVPHQSQRGCQETLMAMQQQNDAIQQQNEYFQTEEMESLFEHRIEELICAAQVRIEQAADKVSDTLRQQVREIQAVSAVATKAAGEAAAAVAMMVQEEKVIISAHMAEKGRERLADELRVKAERKEREKWQQDSIVKHEENFKEHCQNEAEEIKIRRENNTKRAEQVHLSRREKQKIRQKAGVLTCLAARRQNWCFTKIVKVVHEMFTKPVLTCYLCILAPVQGSTLTRNCFNATGFFRISLPVSLGFPISRFFESPADHLLQLLGCSATNRLIPAKDFWDAEHGAVQLNVAQVDDSRRPVVSPHSGAGCVGHPGDTEKLQQLQQL